MWFNIAAATGNELAAENREEITKQMTPEDILETKGMASACYNSKNEKCRYKPKAHHTHSITDNVC